MGRLRLTVVALTTLLAAALPLPATAAPAPLEPAVVQAMLTERATTTPALAAQGRAAEVDVRRQDVTGGWVFGSAVLTAPSVEGAAPDSWLFLARRTARGWLVALDTGSGFAGLAARSPESVLSAGEKATFAANARNAAAPTGLALPYPAGVAWTMIGGPHGWSGQPRPWSSVDLNGGDRRVLAGQSGRAYWMCRNGGHIRIIHDNGWTTEYYHLLNEIKPDGAPIKLGDYLGLTSTRIPCGGSAGSNHVHYAVKKGTAWTALNGLTIGGWTFREGTRAYSGYATHQTVRRNVGQALSNYGPDDPG
ncbi:MULTISPECIES: M23 family metallopeptidase [unclassified Crossiella]|uniref:M23 family metallopeptidase n=1 Tax=unclassified Crossiella TaxID=2620835 RepID=UPI001FFF62FC|nr:MULTISPECIES: M23 family metallopeptidase [unclassified Crossiella]MCK2244821.1 M23 family metallopeptidase [Crossiella sp. S99.2]MCK2258463.1 M23 family metallopeptidase [Crossiella sp. S99.1]